MISTFEPFDGTINSTALQLSVFTLHFKTICPCQRSLQLLSGRKNAGLMMIWCRKEIIRRQVQPVFQFSADSFSEKIAYSLCRLQLFLKIEVNVEILLDCEHDGLCVYLFICLWSNSKNIKRLNVWLFEKEKLFANSLKGLKTFLRQSASKVLCHNANSFELVTRNPFRF